MISFVPLYTAMEKVGMSERIFIKIIKDKPRLTKFPRLKKCKYNISHIQGMCELFNCEIKDLIEYIDEDGNVPEVKGYALCKEDRYDMPHKWTYLIDKLGNPTNYTREDIREIFKICRTDWFKKIAQIRKGEWVKFHKETVIAILEFTGCELWELCEDVRPVPKKVPLEETLGKYMDELFIKSNGGKHYGKEFEKGLQN